MKRGILFWIVFSLFAFFIRSQVNIPFINYLSKKELKREHFAYLEKISAFAATDTASFYKAKFHLQYRNTDFFLEEYAKSAIFFGQDTSAMNYAYIALLRSEKYADSWFQNSSVPQASFYQRSMKNFYAAVSDPVKADFSMIPQKFHAEFSEYKKYYRRKPFVAGALSAVVPGLGKFYAGRKKTFAVTFVSHVLFAARTIESEKVLGIKNPWTIFNLGFSGAFYLANIYGSFADMKKIKKERKTQLLIHASDYYNFNCDCSLAN